MSEIKLLAVFGNDSSLIELGHKVLIWTHTPVSVVWRVEEQMVATDHHKWNANGISQLTAYFIVWIKRSATIKTGSFIRQFNVTDEFRSERTSRFLMPFFPRRRQFVNIFRIRHYMCQIYFFNEKENKNKEMKA